MYVSPLIWDGADNMVFRPLSEAVGVEHHGEAVNVNSLDEVPDSAWFTNRIGVRPIPLEQFALGACRPEQILDPSAFADGSWLIDHGKTDGSSPGFRVNIPGKGKYLFKGEMKDEPERPSAASVIGAAAYEAVGFNTSCEQVVYFRPSLLKLAPGLTVKGNFGATEPFDQKAVDKILADSPHRDGLVRMQASAWLPGYLIGPFTYTGTRHDDPNDVIPHDDRRELRGGRLLAAWLDHFDAREQNSLDTWVTAAPGRPSPSRTRRPVTSFTTTSTRAIASARSGSGRRSRGASATRTSPTGETLPPTSSRSESPCAPGIARATPRGTRCSATSTSRTSNRSTGRTSIRTPLSAG